jgi:hypothetical protein
VRSRAIAVITLSLLLISAAAGYQLRAGILHLLGSARAAPGQEPLQIGRAWDCPASWPFKAYLPSAFYYPAYHPSPPPFEVRPKRCYHSSLEAKAAGFRLAPPPPGGAVAEGVYLVPASARVAAACRAAIAPAGFPIPCPLLLPLASSDDPCSLSTACLAGGGPTTAGFGFTIVLATPPDLTGKVVNRIGFSTFDAATGQLLLNLDAVPLASDAGRQINLCPRQRLGPSVMGRPSIWADCEDQFGHSTPRLTWLSGTAIYAITTREQSPATQRFVEFFASKLVGVG